MPQPKQEFTARQPDYQVSALEKSTGQRGNIGVAWSQSDGSVRIKLNPFVQLEGGDDLVITCWSNTNTTANKTAQTEKQKKELRQASKSFRDRAKQYEPEDDDIPF